MASGGFSFDLCGRNAYLENKGIQPPRFTKTGTTIAGLIFKVLDLQHSLSDPNSWSSAGKHWVLQLEFGKAVGPRQPY